MKRRLPLILVFTLTGFLLLSFTSCSTATSGEEITGVSAEIIPANKYQYIEDFESRDAKDDEYAVITEEYNEYQATNFDQYMDDLITYTEYRARGEEIEEEREVALEALEAKYQAMNGIWGSVSLNLEIDCDNPSSTDAVIVLDVIFHDGTTGTLLGYPDPLISGEFYRESVIFRTSKYVDTIDDLKFVTR